MYLCIYLFMYLRIYLFIYLFIHSFWVAFCLCVKTSRAATLDEKYVSRYFWPHLKGRFLVVFVARIQIIL